MNRQMAAAILEHYMPKRNIHNKNKIDYLAYATAINALRREDALIDRILGIIDSSIEDVEALTAGKGGAVSEERKEGMLLEARAIRVCVENLKGGEQE